ncbi:MAG: nucleoside-diphosphate sugar epimerase/dehydratase [Cyclobacteriaceae bacterium]
MSQMKYILSKINILPRWVIISLDISIVFLGYLVSVLLRFNFSTTGLDIYFEPDTLIILLGTYFLAILFFKTHTGIIRFTHKRDALNIIKSVTMATSLLSLHTFLSYTLLQTYFIPYSILVISAFLNTSILLGYRFVVKELFTYSIGSYIPKKPVVIYGAGLSGRTTAQMLQENSEAGYEVKAFLDDNKKLMNSTVHGKPVLVPEGSLSDIINKDDVKELIIAIQDIEPTKKRWIIEECLKLSITVREVPGVDRWVKGNLSVKQIQEVKIDDLLGRKPIEMASENAIDQFSGKIVMVTGSAGSIGSEICNQLIKCGVLKLVLVDQAESSLYDLEQDLINKYKQIDHLSFSICNINCTLSIENVFKKHRPDIVFHAAAYKHVPLMENQPFEAVTTNVLGTKTLADLSVKYGVNKFVFISTDKAVNPTNIMGATKRIAETYIQSLNDSNDCHCEFITTRFGNVLGSNGSVIPLFRKQIQMGGPVKVTHPEITRFFMTIPEACSLVLEAGAMGKGGEIFIFDMGSSIKIYDLATKMIQLAGLKLGRDIEIEFTGLRPGEKLYEEVLADTEDTKPTYHPKILIANVRENDYEQVNYMVLSLEMLLKDGKETEMVRVMKRIVPEFKSKESRFEVLD